MEMFGKKYCYRCFQRITASFDYRYIERCRCGAGPNAYYQSRRGQFLRAWDFHPWSFLSQENPQDELIQLKTEKIDIQKAD